MHHPDKFDIFNNFIKRDFLKIKNIFFLLLFTSFLVAPSVINMCNTDADVSYFFSMSEEETIDNSLTDTEKQTHKETSLPENMLWADGNLFPLDTDSSLWNKLFSDTTNPPPEYFTL